jgi:hypothetical protein
MMADDQQARSPEAEAAVHLIRAGREFLAAARSVIDALDAYLEVAEQRVGQPRKASSAGVQAIPIRRDQRV